MYHVYILYSHSCGRRYIGHTDDLARRVRQHNDPEYRGSKTTKRFAGPWIMIHSETYSTRSAAMKRERWLKSGVGRNWINDNVTTPEKV